MTKDWKAFILETTHARFNEITGADIPERTFQNWKKGIKDPGEGALPPLYVQKLISTMLSLMPSDGQCLFSLEPSTEQLLNQSDIDDPWEKGMEINRAIQSYYALIESVSVRFTVGEWSAILDANNGMIIDANMTFGIAANVFDSGDFSEKWGVNNDDLGTKLMKLPRVALFRVGEIIHRYWTSPNYTDKQPEEFIDARLICSAPLDDPCNLVGVLKKSNPLNFQRDEDRKF